MKTFTSNSVTAGKRLLLIVATCLLSLTLPSAQLMAQSATISGDASVCAGSSTNLIIDFSGTAPFTYSYSDGTTTFGPFATSSDPATVAVSPAVNTTYSLVSMSDANGPGTVSGSAVISVDAAPPVGSITSSGLVVPATGCNGDVVAVTCNAVPGATGYTWTTTPGTLVNGNASPFTTTTNNASLTLGALPSGSSYYDVCVYASNACGVSNARCKKIRGAVSTPGPISGNVIACAGASGNYSTNTVAGAASYNWTATGGIVINSGNGTTSVNVTYPAGFTSGTLCVNAALPCGSTSANRCLSIASGPSALGVMTGSFAVCPGATSVAYSVPADPAITTYNWVAPPNASIASGQGTNTVTIDYTSSYTGGQVCVTGTSVCGTATASRCKHVTSGVPGRPGNIIGQSGGVCGLTLNYSVNPVSGATSYTWTVPAAATLVSGQGTNTISVSYPLGFTGGQICVTADNSCGSSQSRCINIRGIPSDPAAISGPSVVCDSGIGLVYSIADVDGATNYIWNVPAGATIVSGQGTTSITVDWGTSSGLVTVIASNACGNSGTETLNVIYSISPATPGPINGPEFVCAPQTGVVYSISSVPGAQGYLWYFAGNQGGATFVGATNDTTVTVDFAVSTNSVYKLRVIALNSYCGNSPYSGKQLRQDISVPHLNGASFVCAGDSSVYTIPSAVVGAASYTFTAPTGATIDGNPSPFNTTNLSVTIVFPAGFTSGDVCVAAVDPCGNATADRCLAVRSTPLEPGKVFGPSKVCTNTTNVMYYTNPVPGATSYTWTAPANASIASGQGNDTVYVDFSGFISGDVCVTADNNCGSSTAACKSVVQDQPATPSNIIGPITGLCGGSFSYSVTAVPGLTYNWTVPAGAQITSGSGTNAVTIDFSGVTFPSVSNQYLQLCVSASNGCSNSSDRCVAVKGISTDPGAITGPASVCANQTGVAYSITPVTGAVSYLWTVPAGASISAGAGTNSITVDFGTNAGSVTVRAQNACGNSGSRALGVAMPCRFANGSDISLNVYPNPADEILNISFSLEKEGEVEAVITDLAGKMVSSETINAGSGLNTAQYNVSGIAKGVYILQVKDANSVLGNIRVAIQ